jgi:hypothetical protein
MKTKWLVILSVLFLMVIFLSLLITQKNQKVFLSEESIPANEQSVSSVPLFSQPRSVLPIVAASSLKTGVTVIKKPVINPEEKSISVPKIADKTENIISSQNVVPSQNVTLSGEDQDLPQTGITIIGKKPSPKEAQEMNSRGITLY